MHSLLCVLFCLLCPPGLCPFPFPCSILVDLGEVAIFLFSPVSPLSSKALTCVHSSVYELTKEKLKPFPFPRVLASFYQETLDDPKYSVSKREVCTTEFQAARFGTRALGWHALQPICSSLKLAGEGGVKSQPAGRNRRGSKGREQRNPGIRRKAGWLQLASSFPDLLNITVK